MKMPEGLLIDLDDTIYDYGAAHEPSMELVRSYCRDRLKVERNEFDDAFRRARGMIHVELDGTASSHNRLLYFQRMLELLNVPALKHARELSELYWNSFLERMRPYDGAMDVLARFSPEAICIVTDLTADIQFRKLEKLDLAGHVGFMVTSEEAGIEKPAADMFHAGLRKLNLKTEQVCMVGDNFAKDIHGAMALNIEAIWFNPRQEEPKHGSPGKLEHAPTGKTPEPQGKSGTFREIASFSELLNAWE